jgi:hypothetical protein
MAGRKIVASPVQSRDAIRARNFPEPISFFATVPLMVVVWEALDDLRMSNDSPDLKVSTDCASSR